MAKNKNKEIFIEEILTLVTKDGGPTLSDEAWEYFNELRNSSDSNGALTEAGEKVLTWIRDNTTKEVMFMGKAINIAQ